MAQNGSLNGHKLAKNIPNELKIRPEMYFHEFYQIPEGLLKFCQNCPIFGRKNSHLARFLCIYEEKWPKMGL